MKVVVYDRTIEQKTDKNLKEAKMDIEGQLKDGKTDINQNSTKWIQKSRALRRTSIKNSTKWIQESIKNSTKMDTRIEKVQDTMWAIKNSLIQLESYQQTKKS